MSFWIYIYSGTPLARPPTGRHSIGRIVGAGMVASHLHSWRFHVLSRSIHFYNYFLHWKLFSFVLRAAKAYRYCTIKSHNGKSWCRHNKFQTSLQHAFVTSHWHILRLHSCLHTCIHDASGQRDAAEQIAADRLPAFQPKDTDRVCGRVTRCSISSFVKAGLWPGSGYRGGCVSETKGDALA